MAKRGYSDADLTWMAVGVQAGFVAGPLSVAILNLPDLFRPQRVYLLGAVLASASASASAAAFSLLPDQSAGVAIGTRVVLGAALAAVYPVGMKMLAGWYRDGRGLVLGIAPACRICSGPSSKRTGSRRSPARARRRSRAGS